MYLTGQRVVRQHHVALRQKLSQVQVFASLETVLSLTQHLEEVKASQNVSLSLSRSKTQIPITCIAQKHTHTQTHFPAIVPKKPNSTMPSPHIDTQ